MRAYNSFFWKKGLYADQSAGKKAKSFPFAQANQKPASYKPTKDESSLPKKSLYKGNRDRGI